LIEKAPLAYSTTLNSKGGPQVTVVWVGIENDDFVIGHLAVAGNPGCLVIIHLETNTEAMLRMAASTLRATRQSAAD
jgi:hypothetical protein